MFDEAPTNRKITAADIHNGYRPPNLSLVLSEQFTHLSNIIFCGPTS
jgi:hypothetical protein